MTGSITKKTSSLLLTGPLPAMFLVFSGAASAQDMTEERSDEDVPRLFSSHSVLDVRIDAPLTTLMRDRPEEEYLDGTFAYTDDAGTTHELDLKLQTRGKYRRQKKTCTFPPVRLNFRKGQVAGTLFAGQDKLKLVTHCNNRRSNYEQLVLREYLAYRIFGVLTDKSFGARLMRIAYTDTEQEESMTKFGFVFEDEDAIGARLGMQTAEVTRIDRTLLDARQTNLVSVYQYLIGNTDFSVIAGPKDDTCCHNAVLYGAHGEAPYFPIPYDLDFSGLVDAPYAGPNPKFKIRSVRTRLYRGRCSNNEYLPETLQYFQDKQGEIMALVDELDGLADRDRREVTNYLDGFFEIIADPKQVERRIIGRCN